jgi:hypothetical protein
MAFGDAIISTASGRPIPENTNAALAPGSTVTGNGTPRQSNIGLIAFGIAVHRASTAAFH